MNETRGSFASGMQRKRFLAAVLACAAGSAFGVTTTYLATFDGVGASDPPYGSDPRCVTPGPFLCPVHVPFQYRGDVAVTIDNAEDGDFTGSHLLDLTVRNSISNFRTDGFGSGTDFRATPGAITASISRGRLYFLQGTFWQGDQETVFSFQSVFYFAGRYADGSLPSYPVNAHAFATLVAVPEPSSMAVMMAGVAVISVVVRGSSKRTPNAASDHR